jgi:hypothetical protein
MGHVIKGACIRHGCQVRVLVSKAHFQQAHVLVEHLQPSCVLKNGCKCLHFVKYLSGILCDVRTQYQGVNMGDKRLSNRACPIDLREWKWPLRQDRSRWSNDSCDGTPWESRLGRS